MGPWQNCDPAFDKSPEGLAVAIDALQAAGHPVILTELGQYCCPDPANMGIDTGVCSDGASAVGADYDGFYGGVAMSYNSAVLAVAQSKSVSWTLWAWVPGADGSDNLGSCAYPMVNVGTQLIGHDPGSFGQGEISGTAKCDATVTITDNSHGANMTALWATYF